MRDGCGSYVALRPPFCCQSALGLIRCNLLHSILEISVRWLDAMRLPHCALLILVGVACLKRRRIRGFTQSILFSWRRLYTLIQISSRTLSIRLLLEARHLLLAMSLVPIAKHTSLIRTRRRLLLVLDRSDAGFLVVIHPESSLLLPVFLRHLHF